MVLQGLLTQRDEILRVKEMMVKFKRKARWEVSGDRNTKYFHHLANHRRLRNTIWEMDGGDLVSAAQNMS